MNDKTLLGGRASLQFKSLDDIVAESLPKNQYSSEARSPLPLSSSEERSPQQGGKLPAPTTKPSTGVSLRLYQVEMVGDTYCLIRNGATRILIVAVMGLGKTLIASWIIRDAVFKKRRCVFLVTLNVLISQTADALGSLGVDCTVLQGDRPVDPDCLVVIASVQTISARLRRGATLENLLGTVEIFLVDEAHVAAFHSTYQSIEDSDPKILSF